MVNKFKNIILYTLLTLITASLGITALISNIFKDSTIYLLLSSLVCIVIIITLLNFNTIKIKDLINSTFVRVFCIIYLILSIIYYLSILGILINNLFYVITPITISLSVIVIFIVFLSCNKKIINVNLFFVIGIFCFFILIFFMLLFPSSNLKLDFINFDYSSIYLYSYSILITDFIFYKFYFSSKIDKLSSKTLIISVIIALLLLLFYTFLDLTITKIDYTNTPFRNILKYQLVLPNVNVYFDLFYLVIVIITFTFKILIFGDNLRVFFLCKKNIKNFFIMYLAIFLISNTLTNQVKNEISYLYTLLSILSCFSIILIITIGGLKIVKRIYQFTKK